MTVTFFLNVVKRSQVNQVAKFHYLDGTTETKIIGKAHTLKHLKETMEEAVDLILHPESFYWGPDYPDGFPENFL